VDRAQPKRCFKSNKLGLMSLHDPKRVHSCLKEYNDISASRIYTFITEQMQTMLKQDEREKMKKNADLGQGEKVNSGDMTEKLSLLTQDKNAKIIEKKEFLDMNDALVNTSVSVGELDNEVAIIKKKAARLKAGNIQQLIAANDGLAAEVSQFSQFDEFIDADVAFLIKSEEENYN
jgi:uncharacterized small protein (DUF1192 family)